MTNPTPAPMGEVEALLAEALRALELIRTEKLSNSAYANAVGIARLRLDAAIAALRRAHSTKAGEAVAWARSRTINDRDGRPIGSDDPEVVWGREKPDDDCGWFPLVLGDAVSWRCFHCDEVFTDKDAARLHFGDSLQGDAICQLNALEGGLVKLVRDQEDELHQFRSENSAHYREFYALGSKHQTELRREEEKGYARGLEDGRALVSPTKAEVPQPAGAPDEEKGK